MGQDPSLQISRPPSQDKQARATNGRPYKKRRGGFHIRPCRLRQDKLPRAHIECAPTDFVSAQMRPLSWPPLRGGSARRRWGREPCGSPEYCGPRLAKNFCRGEHCSPVPVCLARKLSRKMRCGGKLAGDQWSPLQKNVGADSISARARLRQGKPPRAHIECAPTDFAFDKGRKHRAGRPYKKRRGGFHIRPCPFAAG